MTEKLFIEDAYRTKATGVVIAHTQEGGIVLDATIFYPTGGGQPGDSGRLLTADGEIPIATTLKGQGAEIVLVPAEPVRLPAVGTSVTQVLDWTRRHYHMRVHTALHLLSVIIPLPVTGGAITSTKGRLDFAMPEPPQNKDTLEEMLNDLISQDLPVTTDWITEAELAANPGLVKTMSVKPPSGAGKVCLVRIGAGDYQVDLQPCGGTHVARTAEIGRVRLGKVENKGKQNRRVNLLID